MPIQQCACVNADPVQCLAQRYEISTSLSICLRACECRCHKCHGGVPVARCDWEANRKRVYRPIQPEEITDPRIKALMKEEAS